MIVRIATRQSPLALWQANHVATLLSQADPTVTTELVSTETFADRDLSLPITDLGGKGAFSKEIQDIVLAGEADIAVHSAKDLQAITPEGLTIGAVPVRGDVRDALIGCTLDDLAIGATVATGSNRRRVQLAHLRPDLHFVGLRGNIATRLSRLDGFDALVMAHAALGRLDLAPDVVDVLDPAAMVPQVGQGALAVECRVGDAELRRLLSSIDDETSRATVEAERGFLVELGGDCDLPAGANASMSADGGLVLRAVLTSADESRLEVATVRSDHATGPAVAEIGAEAARELRARLES